SRLRAVPGATAVVALIILALLFELRAAPLRFMRGAVYPDQITLRLKATPMRGGLVELPTGGGTLPHLYMLRAADHGRPLINAISTFVPQHAWEIDKMSHETPIPPSLLDALEKVPTSYLVIHNQHIDPTRLPVFESFLVSGVASGRLRFINRFDGRDDLYAVVKTEPEARGEAALPFGLPTREWAAMVEDDPINLLGMHARRSQQLYRVLFVAGGAPPRYAEFVRDAREVGRGIFPGSDEQLFQENLRRFAESLTQTPEFKRRYNDGLDGAQYVERLLASAGVERDAAARAALADDLTSKRKTRADILLEVADDARFVEREQGRSFIVLHYFAFLYRNPGDPPDRDLVGFDFWVRNLETWRDPDKITSTFRDSIEYNEKRKDRR
ncbi:MAG: hypothetical protein H7Z38_00690, partial [Rubrivivax sp.]|nr:hypothetical protein [Pyrinomonadaceae bacterium]